MDDVANRAGPALRASSREDGFTLIEVLVAATLLVVGVLATLSLVDSGTSVTRTSLQRDTGNALAREVIETAQGMRYTSTMNDMTDVRPTSVVPTPAHRIRAVLDPTPPSGPRQSTAPVVAGTSTPIASAAKPWETTASWTVVRRNTTYTVTYRACTHSSVVKAVSIAGPYDCARPTTDPQGDDVTPTSALCQLGLTNPGDITQENVDRGSLTVKLQLLGILGLDVCLSGPLPTPLAESLCTLLGRSPSSVLRGVSGLSGVLNLLNSGAGIGLCPYGDIQQTAPDVAAGVASSTEIETTVSWTDPESGRSQNIVQSAVVRRAAS